MIFTTLLSFGALGLCLADSENTVRWCTISEDEAAKCSEFQKNMETVAPGSLTCVNEDSYRDCIQSISTNQADAVTLDSGLVFVAGHPRYKLKPVVAEVYGSEEEPQTHYYAVAVVKKDTSFQVRDLRGRRSCHTGFGRSAGWNVPIGTLRPKLNRRGPPVHIERAVSRFFSQSCVPCINGKLYPNLCSLCVGQGASKCACSTEEPYFGYSGAFRCLQDGAGEVAFVKDSTVFENLPNKADRDQYELLCLNNTRKPVDEFKNCHWARVPSHAVVARSGDGKEELIWELLRRAQELFGKNKSSAFQLFASPAGKKDLLFKDSAIGFLRIPSRVDVGLYLGFEYFTALQNLRRGARAVQKRQRQVVWCAVGSQELNKCRRWSRQSTGTVTCASANTGEDCIALIMKGDADAMSLDGGLIYTAGKCGLVPVLTENAKSQEGNNSACVNRRAEGYRAVAVVRTSDADITWNSVRGRKSCHTAVGRTAGWNIPMGLLFNQTRSCMFDQYFSQSCAPGAEQGSSLCALCIGDESGQNKCVPNNSERYFGYTGAFRCLAERAGDVAFVKDVTVLDNTNGKNTDPWAKDLKLEDFSVLCLNGSRMIMSQAGGCFLSKAPNHAVVSRIDKAAYIENVLLKQQELFGTNGSKCPSRFCLFQSETKNLLFNDNTECLARLQGKTTYETYLGAEYVTAVANLKTCSSSPLLEACTFLQR